MMDDCLAMSALDVARLLLVTFNCEKSRHTNSTGDNDSDKTTQSESGMGGWKGGMGRDGPRHAGAASRGTRNATAGNTHTAARSKRNHFWTRSLAKRNLEPWDRQREEKKKRVKTMSSPAYLPWDFPGGDSSKAADNPREENDQRSCTSG